MSEYVTRYKVEGYSRDYLLKTLKSARYVAIKESMKEPRPYMDNGKSVMNYHPKWIDEIVFLKANGFLQQSGNAKDLGYVNYISEKQKWLWRPSNKKDSVWLDKEGGATRRLTPKERDLYLHLFG